MEFDKIEYNLLIVEDNPGDIILINEYLEDAFKQIKISVCRSFGELIELVGRESVKFDACLLDLSLPDLDGKNLITEIQILLPDTSIIVLTGYSNIDFSIESMKMGITDYLVKDEITALTLYKSIIYSLERRKNISKLKESEKRYSHLFNFSTLPKILFEIDSKKIIQTNLSAIETYGYSEMEFLNLDISALFTKSSYKAFLENNPLNKKNSEHVHITKSGRQINVELNSSIFELNNVECCLISANDITEKIQFQKYVDETILKTQEDERYEIGAELHDNVCQVLATGQIYLSILKERTNSEEHSTYFKSINDLIQQSLNEIRNISHQMAPSFFEDSKLQETLPILIENFDLENETNISIDFDSSIEQLELNEVLHLNLFRIIQEQLSNIKKYAKAKNVKLHLSFNAGLITLKIQDDGIGFDRNKRNKGIGLSNMERRVGLLNGRITIESKLNEGCNVLAVIPISS